MGKTLEVKTGFKIAVWNKCRSLGVYYPEDDWCVEATAETYEKALEKVIPEVVEREAVIDRAYVEKVEYVIWKGREVVLSSVALVRDVIPDLESHELYKRLLEEYRAEKKRLEQEEERRRKLEQERKERELYEKLKKKFEK